jgi:hypothetical protein
MDFSHRPRRQSGLARQVALALALTLAAGTAAAAGPGFEGQGRVTGVDAGRNTVTLEHGGIPGLFPPARSEFPVAEAGLVRRVRPGDHVRFTLAAPEETHGLLTIASLSPEAPAGAGWLFWFVVGTAAVLALGLGALVTVGVLLWRTVQGLHRRVVALNREAVMLRGLVTETQEGVRQMAHALEDTATTLRIGYVRELFRRTGSTPPAGAPDAGSARGLGEPARALVVVQRGRRELYRAVESGAVGPGCSVIWDRRRTDRRAGTRRPVPLERRRAERRAAPAETWTRLGFQLVPGSAADGRAARLLRPASGERGSAR